MNRQLDLMVAENAMRELAQKLALALIDEVTFVQTFAAAAEASLEVLAEARELLNLEKELDEIDLLNR